MRIIVPCAKVVTRVLGAQKKQADTEYRLLSFCVRHKVEDGVLLYNPMTLELVLLSDEEADRITESDELISKWFLVPKDNDDVQLADKLREITDCLKEPVDHIKSYTIFTTTDCNARCYYCFEKGCERKDMSADTANCLRSYIAQHCGGKEVNLHWFGGEPLVNSKVIDIICEGLLESGVKYDSSMISNGYLFDEETVSKAVKLWRLKNVQITLDGTEEVYNRTKAYVNAEGSPFRRVMQSIDLLTKANIKVSVRLNVSEYNYQDLMQLADELAQRFKGRKGINVYCCPLLGEVEVEEGKPQWIKTQSESLLKKYREVRNRLLVLGIYIERRLPRVIRMSYCMGDNDGATTVLPDGSLGCCEHFTESEIFGHIDSTEKDKAVLAEWKEQLPPGDECPHCTRYPWCRRLKKCPNVRVCNAEERVDMEAELLLQILNEYSIYKKWQAAKESSLAEENC